MPATDIQKMFILDCDFKFGADEGVSAWIILKIQLLLNRVPDIRLREAETISYNPGELLSHPST